MTPLPVFTLGTDGTFTAVAQSAQLPTATDGTVRSNIIGLSGFTGGAPDGSGTGNGGREVLTGPDGNNMDTESFLASLHCISSSNILDQDGNVIIAANK